MALVPSVRGDCHRSQARGYSELPPLFVRNVPLRMSLVGMTRVRHGSIYPRSALHRDSAHVAMPAHSIAALRGLSTRKRPDHAFRCRRLRDWLASPLRDDDSVRDLRQRKDESFLEDRSAPPPGLSDTTASMLACSSQTNCSLGILQTRSRVRGPGDNGGLAPFLADPPPPRARLVRKSALSAHSGAF